MPSANATAAASAACVRPADARWRPFCSERCRNEDLARWADGRYHVAGEPVPDRDSETDADPTPRLISDSRSYGRYAHNH